MYGASPADEWGFKEVWDARTSTHTGRIWGGSFQTKAIDYDDDETGYDVLDLRPAPHYYNVLLTPREMREFSTVNPGLSYIACEGPCMTKMHYHGVHGFYKGAFVGGVPCAPPLDLIPAWNRLQRFNPMPVAEMPVDATMATLTASEHETPTPGPSIEQAPQPFGDGALVLAETINQRRPWSAILEIYRQPITARWASLDGITASKTARQKIQKEWNTTYMEKLMPLLRGEGTPVVEVIQCAWDLDPYPGKNMASYMLRRMVAGDSGIKETPEGNLTA